jgi:hypothetical protein
MVRATGASRNTLKDHSRNLVEKQQLTPHGTGKGSWHALPLAARLLVGWPRYCRPNFAINCNFRV